MNMQISYILKSSAPAGELTASIQACPNYIQIILGTSGIFIYTECYFSLLKLAKVLPFSGGGAAVSITPSCCDSQSIRDQTEGSDRHYR